jgi:indolepyruvate decarboxylase
VKDDLYDFVKVSNYCTSQKSYYYRAIKGRLANAKSLVVMVSYMVDRLGLTEKCLTVIEKLGCPFVSTPMDKAVLPETHPQFAGTYKGQMSVSSVRELVESADTILDIGGILFDDLSTGFGTASILKENLIQLNGREAAICLGHPTESFVQNKATSYRTCYLGDVLDELINDDSLPKFTPAEPIIPPKKWPSLGEVQGETSTGIMYASIGAILQEFLISGDIFVCEVGTSSGLYSNMVLPGGSRFICQTLWGSIGYATPAVLGASLSSPDSRVVMVTGDGAHLMSANELGTMAKYKIKPIIIVLNNGVYGVEEFLEKNVARSYNDLGGWKYAEAAKAMGCDEDWITVRVDTVADLVGAMSKARDENKAAYIEAQMEEILLDPMSSSKLSLMYFDNPQ